MKRLCGIRQRVGRNRLHSAWFRIRWIVGLVILAGCSFLVKEQRANATKVVHEHTISRKFEQPTYCGSKAKSHNKSLASTHDKPIVISYNEPLAKVPSKDVPSKDVPSKDVPPTFGKSHFIVGMSAEETARRCSVVPVAHADEAIVDAYDMVCLGVFPQVLFSPHDDVRKTLVHLIDQEKKSIKIAAYTVTEPKVAQALVSALKRGVTITLVVDRSCLDMTSQKIKLLKKAGVEIAIFDGKTREEGALMHNKFFLFEENLKGKKLIWTGSANMTKSGYERNHENVIIVEDPTLFVRYTKEFALLMTVADRLKS